VVVTAAVVLLVMLVQFVCCAGLAAVAMFQLPPLLVPRKPADQKPAEPPEPLEPFGEMAHVGPLRIQVVAIGRKAIHSLRPWQEDAEVREQLAVEFSITNTHGTRIVEREGWTWDFARLAPQVRDSHGNSLRTGGLMTFDKIEGIESHYRIKPGETIRDLVLIEEPLPTIAYLDVTIPMENPLSGQVVPIRWRITREHLGLAHPARPRP
jgi:hypothetical protein